MNLTPGMILRCTADPSDFWIFRQTTVQREFHHA